MYAAAFGFFVFASVGLPGLSGFVGEFLILVGTFAANPRRGRRRDVRDDPRRRLPALDVPAGGLRRAQSEFLKGLGDHLTDMRPVEALTLVPLGALVVVFGLFPGLILDLIAGSVTSALAAVQQAAPIALGLWR